MFCGIRPIYVEDYFMYFRMYSYCFQYIFIHLLAIISIGYLGKILIDF